jgi:hypothetical protein
VTPFEGMLLCHDWLSFFFFFTNHSRSAFFLQHNRNGQDLPEICDVLDGKTG